VKYWSGTIIAVGRRHHRLQAFALVVTAEPYLRFASQQCCGDRERGPRRYQGNTRLSRRSTNFWNAAATIPRLQIRSGGFEYQAAAGVFEARNALRIAKSEGEEYAGDNLPACSSVNEQRRRKRQPQHIDKKPLIAAGRRPCNCRGRACDRSQENR